MKEKIKLFFKNDLAPKLFAICFIIILSGLFIKGITTNETSNNQYNSFESENRSLQEKNKKDKDLAINISKKIVIQYLKAPATAQFSNIEVLKDPWSDNDQFTIWGDVDSQNSFGALLRSHFFLDFNYSKNTEENYEESLKINRLEIGGISYYSSGEIRNPPFEMTNYMISLSKSFENKLKELNKLIILRDSNGITLDEFSQKNKELFKEI